MQGNVFTVMGMVIVRNMPLESDSCFKFLLFVYLSVTKLNLDFSIYCIFTTYGVC